MLCIPWMVILGGRNIKKIVLKTSCGLCTSIEDACGDKLSHKSADSGVRICSATGLGCPVRSFQYGVSNVLVASHKSRAVGLGRSSRLNLPRVCRIRVPSKLDVVRGVGVVSPISLETPTR